MPQSRQNSSKRCNEIVGAARKLIVDKGFAGLRTRDIAAEVGINISTLHYHVPSKYNLVEMVAASMMDDIAAHWDQQPDNETQIPNRLRNTLLLHWTFHEKHPDVRVLFGEFMSLSRRDEKVSDLINTMQNGWLNKFIDLLEEGKAQKTLRDNLHSDAFARILVFTITSFWRFQDSSKTNFEQICNELVRSVSRVK